MKLSNSMRRALACVCAVAMVISSITIYSRTEVKASGTATVNGMIYTVTDGNATITGFTCQGIFDKERIHFAWGDAVNADTITATVDGTAVTVDGKSATGMFIPLSEVSSLQEGEYQIVISAVNTKTSAAVTGNATLKIEAEGETTTRDPSVKVWKDLGEGFAYDDMTQANVIGIQQPDWAAEKGIYASVTSGINSVSVNGITGDTVAKIQGAGVIVYLSALTYKTNNVIIEYASGTAQIVIKNENGTGGDAPIPETTTAAPISDGSELLNNTEFADSTDWNEYGFTTATNNGDGSLSVSMEAKTQGDNWSSQLVQNGVSLTEGKWYVAKYTVTSDVDKTFQLMVQSDGAAGGDWSVFSEEFTEVKAGETKNVEMKFQAARNANKNAIFGIMMGYVKDTSCEAANVVISNVSLKVYSNEPTGGETTTPGESETTTATAETTTSTDIPESNITMNQNYTTEGNYELGGYVIYVGTSWNDSTAIAGVDPENPDHIKIQQTASKWSDVWGLQVVKKYSGLTAGATYSVEWPMTASSSDGRFSVTNGNNEEIMLTGGKQMVTGTFTAKENGTAEFVIGLGKVGLTTVIELGQQTVKDAEGNVVYPSGEAETTTAVTETTTSATETTTAATETTTATTETTTAATETTTATTETTEAPTVAPTTQKPTVAPTTQKPTAARVSVGRVKVKSASKRKISTKVKISLKKVKGAKKYQVQISTSKKFKKVLVKKTVKKAIFLIKSSKIKNKKKLYVRIRAVKVVNKKAYTGKWSRLKKVKIKK